MLLVIWEKDRVRARRLAVALFNAGLPALIRPSAKKPKNAVAFTAEAALAGRDASLIYAEEPYSAFAENQKLLQLPKSGHVAFRSDCVELWGRPFVFTPAERLILTALYFAGSAPLSRADLAEACAIKETAVATHVCRINRAVSARLGVGAITGVYGVGYRLASGFLSESD